MKSTIKCPKCDEYIEFSEVKASEVFPWLDKSNQSTINTYTHNCKYEDKKI